VFDPEMLPGRLPISTNEMRGAHRATMLTGITDTFLYAQRGYLEYGFIGGAQIDRYGNVNTSLIGTLERPKVKLPGSGGANDIVSLCREVMIVTMHEKRRFVERVDFITSPGFLQGGRSREAAGLHFGQVSQIITNLGLLDFDEQSRAMRLRALHPGVTVAEVQDNTGFDLVIPEQVATTLPPSETELALVRRLDPDRRYLG
jgi:glutaconate CoA-transferase subunit B